MRAKLLPIALSLSLLAACQGSPTAPTRGASPRPKAPSTVVPSAPLVAPVIPTAAPVTPIISDHGGGVVSNNGAGVVSNNGAGVRGTVRALAALVPGYRTLALDPLQERPVGGVPVALQTADGKAVTYQDGKPVTTTTAADGSYSLAFGGNTHNMVVVATLPANKGTALAFVPKGVADQALTVDLDTAATLELQYVLESYVRVQAEPIAVLDKLPPAVEADTRAKLQAAIATNAPVVDVLTPQKVVATVESLRRAAPAVSQQLEYVRSLLFAGLSNQGIGLPATDVELDPVGLAFSPAGELYFAQTPYGRIFKKAPDGHVVVVAGNGFTFQPGDTDLPGEGLGDGGPATAAAMTPSTLQFDATGRLYVLDASRSRVRRIATDGTIETYAALKPGALPTAMGLGRDGTLWLATAHGVLRVDDATRKPTLVAGVEETGISVAPDGPMGGDGGPPQAARFTRISGLAVDPASGEPLVFDQGALRRIGASKVELVAGSATLGRTDGPAKDARFGPIGALAFGPDGTLCVADGAANTLRALKDGVVTTIAGNGQVGAESDEGTALAQVIGTPGSPTYGPDGTLYFQTEGMVRALKDGRITTIAGLVKANATPRTPADVQFETPKWLRYDAAHDAMLVADFRHVWRWSLADDLLAVFASASLLGDRYQDGGSLARAALLAPSGLALADDGAVEYLVRDPYGNRMLLLHQAGDAATTAIQGRPGSTDELDPDFVVRGGAFYTDPLVAIGGKRYFAVPLAGHVRAVEADGTTTPVAGYGTAKADGSPARDFALSAPNCLERGPDGQLYVGTADGAFRIDLATQAITRVYGKATRSVTPPKDGQRAVDAPTLLVGGLAWDARGRLLVADALLHTVARVEADGTLEVVAGPGSPNWNGSTVDDGLGAPTGMAFDKRGMLYVADASAAQIKRIPAANLP